MIKLIFLIKIIYYIFHYHQHNLCWKFKLKSYLKAISLKFSILNITDPV